MGPDSITSKQRTRRRRVKSVPQLQKNRPPWSTELADIRDLIQTGGHTEAMKRLDALASRADRRDVRAKILNQVGLSQERRGKMTEASRIFDKAHDEAKFEIRGWLQPCLCRLRVLLKDVQLREAHTLAESIWNKTSGQDREEKDVYERLERDLRNQGRTRVRQRPVRASVVGYRIGQAFLEEGESQAAELFFLRAVKINPHGASRARQSLAEIALRRGDGIAATQRAAEALILGKFQAKTVSAWPLYLRGLKLTGQTKVDARLMTALARAKPDIRARCVLAMSREMRRLDLPEWKKLVEGWLKKEAEAHPVEAAEIRAMCLAQARLEKNHALVEQLALHWKETPKITVLEYLSSAKALVSARSHLKKPLELDPLLEEGTKRYGARTRAKIRHALALTCLAEGLGSQAETLFRENVRTTDSRYAPWCRSIWRLATLAVQQKNWEEAVAWYKRFYENPHAPEKLRLTARLEAVRCLLQANRPDLFDEIRPALEDAVARSNDWEQLLDLSRQLNLAPEAFADLKQTCWSKATSLSWKAFETAPDAVQATEILFKLARRRNDLADFNGMIADWEKLTPTKRDWIWCEASYLWDYLSYLVRAYAQVGRVAEAERCVLGYLDQADTPAYGRSIIKLSLGLVWVASGKVTEGVQFLESALSAHPTHELAAYAWYWMALRSWKAGNQALARTQAARIREILPESNRMQWAASLRRRGQLLESSWAKKDIEKLKDETERKRFLAESEKINRDLQRL
jgi:tetratricopeptide (TPR) repeat protein